MRKLPELLAPAGSFLALEAAIEAGADAVYFAGESFGARAYAKNFTREEIAAAARLCRAYGVKSYITLNTLIFDREMEEVLSYAAFLEKSGIDALIIADMGAAREIHRAIPSMELHASTQFSGHSLGGAELLSKCGFSRMVTARESSRENLERLCKASPVEIETFVHGALCVCHSGQCLFSSMVGGRSGNRGMCAQPCRLPDRRGKYPLSLKDLSMAERIPELINTGAASLKIEGRMKAPEYVYGVTKIYRRLLDQRRNATKEEVCELEEIFSRDGFTTGYFDGKIDGSMLGVRSEDAKKKSRELESFTGLKRKLPIELSARLKRDMPFEITVKGEKGSVSVQGAMPQTAEKAPLTEEALKKNILKLGATPFYAEDCEISIDEGLIIRVSEINALRREAVEKYISLDEREHIILDERQTYPRKKEDENYKSALVYREKSLPKEDSFFDYFDMVYLPLSEFLSCKDKRVCGVALPPVIMDTETEKVKADLLLAKEKGAKAALVGNFGHLALVKEAGLAPHGDIRLNITNSAAAAFAKERGFERVILSPELTMAQIRDIGGRVSSVVYGRVPLMLLEKCVIKEISSCEACESDRAELVDRLGVRFPVFREGAHRNIIFNSVPTYALDKYPLGAKHFVFTTESHSEILDIVKMARAGAAPHKDIRRIKEK